MNVIVIGGGPAGVTAALRARELGADVTLVERGRMGGTCTNDGCVPTRVLAKAARLLRDSAQFESYGLMAPSPTLDFPRLMQRVQQVVYGMHEKKQLIQRLEQAGVTVLAQSGEAGFLDPHTLAFPDGRRLQAERFILCAGGRARRLDFPGEELALTHSQVWSLKKLPRSVIVVGAAATGCQLASIFAAFGAQVTLLEVAPRILALEDEAISAEVAAGFTRSGIQMLTGIRGVQSLEALGEPGGMLRLHVLTPGGVKPLEAEAVILSTGWLGNLDALHLEAAGVARRGVYVQVDDSLRTTAPHIYAAGDITGRMMLVQSAGSEALVAAENAVLGGEQRIDHHITAHGGFTDPEYASVGLTEEQARQAGLEYAAATVPFSELDRAVIEGQPAGLCKLIVSRDNHRILGVHVAGEQALEVVHLVAAGITADMWVEQLAEMEIAYPTFAAVVGLAARKIVQDLGVRPLAHQWRSLGRAPEAEWEKSAPGNDFRND
ncbi:MAG TPA: NAD(P)/FAD-dependent oxidoreductase [Anaerolinea sp.]|nr:NAD(P)/FAD-dependent oxidoreductase [Anaerolinea sp.]